MTKYAKLKGVNPTQFFQVDETFCGLTVFYDEKKQTGTIGKYTGGKDYFQHFYEKCDKSEFNAAKAAVEHILNSESIRLND